MSPASAKNAPEDGAAMPLITHYRQLVAGGRIFEDAVQLEVLYRLQVLYDAFASQQQNSKGLRALFSWAREKPEIRGVYLWGNVGRGKSMLMDMFFEAVPVEAKRRVHFHQFMQEMHTRLHELRQTEAVRRGGGDPTAIVIREMAENVDLLCFDELQATDVVDASLIFRLFDGLLAEGVAIVSTSNHPPSSIYTGFVQRERFQKIIDLIETRMDVVALTSPQDYRHRQLQSLHKVYFQPLGVQADAQIRQVIQRLVPDSRPSPKILDVQGRQVRMAAYEDEIGLASFRELCEAPLGPADYLAIAKRFSTLVLTGIPKMKPEKRNEAKRFVTLVDALYEHKVTLIATADAPPAELYPEGDGSFEFQRTVSRLAEMQSETYLRAKRKKKD